MKAREIVSECVARVTLTNRGFLIYEDELPFGQVAALINGEKRIIRSGVGA